jgi:hypothetical protein
MKKVLLLIAATFTGISVQAQNAVFQASLTPDFAIYSKSTEIDGLSLDIWGENPQHGIALGFINGSSGESSGFTWGLVNYAESYRGVSWGFVNVSQTSFVGWQCGWIDVSQGTFTGFQSGRLVNYAQEFHGLQLGLVNYAENLNGVQIGLANIAMNNPWFNEFPDKLATGFPLFNWSF